MTRKPKTVGIILLIGLILVVALSSRGEGVTPLMIASKEGDRVSVERMISEGHNLNERSRYRWTAMIFAASEGHTSIVRLLVEAGADAEVISKPVTMGFLATAGGYPETSVMLEAIKRGDTRLVAYLLDQGITVTATAVTAAADRPTHHMLAVFADKGVSINDFKADRYGRTALDVTARNGNIGNMSWLLANGANSDGSSLYHAIRGLDPQVVAMLIEAGAEIDPMIGGVQQSTLRLAINAYIGDGEDAQLIQIIELLLENGANPDLRSSGASITPIQSLEIKIGSSLSNSLDQGSSQQTRERYKRDYERNRMILDILKLYQSH